MGRMDGKVAIISGGARGMGAEEVRLFAREGAKVVFGDILDELGQQVEADCRDEGLDVAYTHLDVTSEEDWQAIVALAEERYGKLDALVNNAGISISVEGGARNISLEDTSVEQWDRVMDINSKGVFLGTKAAIPAMGRAGGGSIINISSIAGMTGAWVPVPIRTTLPRAPCACSPRPRRCSTPGRASAPTPCTRGRS